MRTSAKYRALVLARDEVQWKILSKILSDNSYWSDRAECSENPFERAKDTHYDLFFLVEPEQENLLKQVKVLLQNQSQAQIFVAAKRPKTSVVVQAIKSGVDQYIELESVPDVLPGLLNELEFRNGSIQKRHLENGETIVAASDPFKKVIQSVEQMRDVDSTVLILGESGTGKELISRLIHQTSTRKEGPFLAVNCAAIPENLLESTLFGHLKGSFTDAKADHKGIFELCNRGSLFLDEVGEMPLSLQSKLLRAIEEREIVPVGGAKPISVDIRIISATNQNLEELCRQKKFRKDLYYRLCVIPVKIPPLRDRPEDIEILFDEYVKLYGTKLGKSFERVEPPLQFRLENYPWPGNVRELRNSVERASVLSQDGKLHEKDLFPDMRSDLEFPQFCPLNPRNKKLSSYAAIRRCCDLNYLRHLLEVSNGNISLAARISGRHRAELYRQMQKFGLAREGESTHSSHSPNAKELPAKNGI